MVVQVKGEFLEVERWPDKTSGEIKVATCVLSGSETLRVLGYDAGDKVKRLDPITVTCEMRRMRDGGTYFKAIAP